MVSTRLNIRSVPLAEFQTDLLLRPLSRDHQKHLIRRLPVPDPLSPLSGPFVTDRRIFATQPGAWYSARLNSITHPFHPQ